MANAQTSITPVLKYIAEELNSNYDNPVTPAAEKFVQLGNISQLESTASAANADLRTKVILTVVNIDEEKTLKNSPFYVRQGEAVVKRNPTVFLNLYVLVSCADEDYETALTQISRVIGFFQQKYVFTADNANPNVPFPEEHVEKIILDLFSLNFEQINHLWGILGGKYIPSVLYKLRLIPFQQSEAEDAHPIKEVKATENNN